MKSQISKKDIISISQQCNDIDIWYELQRHVPSIQYLSICVGSLFAALPKLPDGVGQEAWASWTEVNEVNEEYQ